MKKLFNKYDAYTEDAGSIYTEASKAIGKIYKKWGKEKGYSFREIKLIVDDANSMHQATNSIKHGMKIRMEERNA